MTSGTCRFCHRPIVRGRTYQGARVVVEPEPSEDGTVRLFGDGRVYEPTRSEIPNYRQAGVALHRLHRHR
jgi:hypothetical protein